MRLPVIQLNQFDDQERLIRALYAIGVRPPGAYADVESVVRYWRSTVRLGDGRSGYPFFTLQSTDHRVTAYSYNLAQDEHHRLSYTRINSISQFVAYTRRLIASHLNAQT